ncbi:MAG: hypothetical protein Q8R06_09715 [Polaromonas sp.]|uniref:hypothetical protein n=1 Tax=Polaromonas sp. TaxID=1869339 RepID=UPI00273659DC|nr:hypothetical protein [Polaromonas sp.]MDP3797412.1 hypothetical protein [Polaromonas sp.]
MTNVISLAHARAAKTVRTPAQHPPKPVSPSKAAAAALDAVQLQASIENALSMALNHVRGNASGRLHAATAKANRALTLLKQACTSSTSTTLEG